VLVFDPSGFPKSGRESVGVARQWCGRLGKVDNCQVALSLGYVSRKGHTLVDTRLYLPKPQIRQGIALILHEAFQCGTMSHRLKECQQRLQRNELARFYHWKHRNLLVPLNLSKRLF